MVNFSDQVVTHFRGSVTTTYELEDDVVNMLCTFVRKAIDEVGLPTKAGRARATPTTRRKKSGYNLFVKEQMTNDADIKQLSHREKMSAVGQKWKLLDADAKNKYNDLAKAMAESEASETVEAPAPAAE